MANVACYGMLALARGRVAGMQGLAADADDLGLWWCTAVVAIFSN